MSTTLTQSSVLTSPDVWPYLADVAQHALDQARFMRGRGVWSAEHASPADALDDMATSLLRDIHECSALRPPESVSLRDLDDDLRAVCAMQARLYLGPQDISLSFACEPIVLHAIKSWQACLLVCELVRDAASRPNVASIGVKGFMAEGEVRCVVFDDGMADAYCPTMVDSLAASMGGRIVRCADDDGEIAMVCFPEPAI